MASPYTSLNPGAWAQTVQDAVRNAVFGKPTTGFFQSRITRTPGVVDPNLDPEKVLATYDPTESPSAAVSQSGLDEETKNALMQQWAQNQGLMRIIPGAAGHTIRHESLHDIYQRGNLENISEIMANALRPETKGQLLALPAYQEQAARMGLGTTIANEGMASELADLPGTNPALIRVIVNHLMSQGKKTEAKQFRKLVRKP